MRFDCDWSSDVCSSDLNKMVAAWGILMSPFQGLTIFFTHVPRALPWAFMFQPLRGSAPRKKHTNSREGASTSRLRGSAPRKKHTNSREGGSTSRLRGSAPRKKHTNSREGGSTS